MITFLIFTFLLISNQAFSSEYKGSSAKAVWEIVTNAPFSQLPSNKVSYGQLFDGAISLIERSAMRTLNDEHDILPPFNKLAHPNGICLKGSWKIEKENIYSGLFQKGSEAIILARASAALNETEKGDKRSFGLAGKLFATAFENEIVKTANFFVIDDLGGTKAAHFTDVEMTNEPKITASFGILKYARYALELASTFKKIDAHPGKRQLYEIAEANRIPSQKLKVPKWMMIKFSKNQKKVNESDFRHELDMGSNHGLLSFDILVTDVENKGIKGWSEIGKIEFTDSVTSSACDHQLHFHHPKWRSDIE
jgi:hypothetical protein